MAFDLVEDISKLIEDAISEVTVKGELPADDIDAIAVIPSGGFAPTHTFGGNGNQKPAYIEPTFQVSCKHVSGTTLLTWWDAIKEALDGKINYTPKSTGRTYLVIKQNGDVISLGRDENRRHIQALNFETMIVNAY
jgi:hypothetical protein